MGCCKPKTISPSQSLRSTNREDVVLRIAGASVHLMEGSEAVELSKGDFTILRITENDVLIATAVKIGSDLQWPLTKDEPVIKLSPFQYLFSLPDKDGTFLNYGVTFAAAAPSLDVFLKENACFSTPQKLSYQLNWSECAPRIEDYNGVLGKAIAGGTGEIVKGIFMLSNVYSSQVQKGAEMIKSPSDANKRDDRSGAKSNRSGINKAIYRARKVSEMTEQMSQSLLNGVITITGSVGAPLVQSKAGKAFFSMLPGEVLLASLDAVNKVLDAVELAERNTLAATSSVVAGAVSKRFGESVGEATEDAFATAGHAVGVAWNVFKIRKAINPSSTVSSSILKNAVRKK